MDPSSINATVGPDGHVPLRRFINPSNPKDGTWLYDQIKNFSLPGDLKDWERKRIEAHLRHAEPYSTDELVALGMENMPNFSSGDLETRISDEEKKWTDLITSHSGLWEVKHPDVPAERLEEFNSDLGDALNRTWMDCAAHITTGQLVFRHMACYGCGPALWADPYDPSPISRVSSDFRFPPGMRIDMSNFSECALHDSMSAQDLYRAISDPKNKGWDKSAVMDVLKTNATNDTKPYFESAEKFELGMRSGVNCWKSYTNMDIPVIHVWVNEFEEKDGKTISYVVLAKGTGMDWTIIRSSPHAFSKTTEFLLLATDRVGSDGTISGLRGVGMNLRPRCEANDILGCASAYAAFLSSVPTYTSSNQSLSDTLEQTKLRANGMIIPFGVTQVESKLDVMAAMHFIANNNNTMDDQQGRYGLNTPNKGGVQRTAEEARQDSAKEGEVRSAQVAPLTKTFFEPLGINFFKRIIEFPRDDKGQPLKHRGWEVVEAFDKNLKGTNVAAIAMVLSNGKTVKDAIEFLGLAKVSFNSANTPGGLDKKLLRSDQLLGLTGMMTSQRQRDLAVNSKIIALMGYKGAKPYLNASEASEVAQMFQERISTENALMAVGQKVDVFEIQDHLRHLGPLDPQGFGHVPFLMAELAKVQQNAGSQFETDPLDELGEKIDALLEMKDHVDMHLAHCMHNSAIAENPAIQPYFHFVGQVENAIRVLAQGFAKELEARQTKEGVAQDPKVQSIMALTQAKIAAMNATTKANLDAAALKHNVKVGQQVELAGVRSKLKTAATLTDMAISAEKQKTEALKAQTAAMQTQDQVRSIIEAKTKSPDTDQDGS